MQSEDFESVESFVADSVGLSNHLDADLGLGVKVDVGPVQKGADLILAQEVSKSLTHRRARPAGPVVALGDEDVGVAPLAIAAGGPSAQRSVREEEPALSQS